MEPNRTQPALSRYYGAPTLELRHQQATHAWHTLSLWELQQHGSLGPLLGTPALWPDHPDAAKRANSRVFWPGLVSPRERAAAGTVDGGYSEMIGADEGEVGDEGEDCATMRALVMRRMVAVRAWGRLQSL